MNLTQVLREALPDAPPQRVDDRPPRCHPRLIVREHPERDGVMYHCIVPNGPTHFFRFNRMQYDMATSFQGQGTYAAVIRTFREKTGMAITEEILRKVADSLERQEFWFRTNQEKSSLLADKLLNDRHACVKKAKGVGDLSTIELVYFNPENFLAWLHRYLKFMYTPWFSALAFVMILVAISMLAARWSEVWNDTLQFYNLTLKSFWDLLEFFAIFTVLGAVHEVAHGLTCTHFGGRTQKMGAYLLYLTPAVFCDVSQAYVYGRRFERMMTSASGVWGEMIVVSLITYGWWFTVPGTWFHDLAYKFILSGGILVVMINWNPLSKLDGYYIFSELFRVYDLKGQSTKFLSAWVRNRVFGMPAKVPNIPMKRQVGFIAYAFLSGIYCYSMLLFFTRILYRVVHSYSPDWAILPAIGLAIMIFRSRIKKLIAFSRDLYRDKKDVMKLHWPKAAAVAAGVVLISLFPIKREAVDVRFVLEPSSRVALRAEVPGTVAEVLADEGQSVSAGQTLVRMGDLDLESQAAHASADYQQAVSRTTQAQLHYTNYASAEQERLRLAQGLDTVHDRQRRLTITSPINGVVTSPRTQDLEGTYLIAGTPVLEVSDLSHMRARLYVPEPDLKKLQHIESVRLRMDSQLRSTSAVSLALSPTAQPLEPGLMTIPKYKGQRPPAYYTLNALVDNPDGSLRDGMSGTAHITGERRSLAAWALGPLGEAIARRAW